MDDYVSINLNGDEFKKFLMSLPKEISPYKDFENFYDSVRSADVKFPSELAKAIDEIKFGFVNRVLIIKKFTWKTMRKNAKDNATVHNGGDFSSEAILILVAQQFGYTYGYSQERMGQIIQNILPEADKANVNSSEGSEVPLELHIDNGYLSYPPDYVLLQCLKEHSEHPPSTKIIPIEKVIQKLDSETLITLMKPLYRIRFSNSFVAYEDDCKWSDCRPVIESRDGKEMIRIKLGVTKGVTETAEEALLKLQNLFENQNLGQSLELNEGDIMIIPNNTFIHGRSKYKASFDGNDRWLHRVYVAKEVSAIKHNFKSGKRVISTL